MPKTVFSKGRGISSRYDRNAHLGVIDYSQQATEIMNKEHQINKHFELDYVQKHYLNHTLNILFMLASASTPA